MCKKFFVCNGLQRNGGVGGDFFRFRPQPFRKVRVLSYEDLR